MPRAASKPCPCGCGHSPRSNGNKMRPLQCDGCDTPLRVSYLTVTRMAAFPPCFIDGCTGRFVPCCLEDLFAMDEDAARAHPAYGRCIMGFSINAAIKAARKGGNGRAAQCTKCARIIRHGSALCSCGWQNDARGGGYYSAAGCANDNVAMPF